MHLSHIAVLSHDTFKWYR